MLVDRPEEMPISGVRTLCVETGIEPDWGQVKVVLLTGHPLEERLAILENPIREWQPAYLCLDPMAEFVGLDKEGIRNPAIAAERLNVLLLWAREGRTVEGFHYHNNAGNVADSYKIRAKADHYYEIRGDKPSSATIEYKGRTRAIPPKRRMTGDADEGYSVTVVDPRRTGRPAESMQKVLRALNASTVLLSVSEIAENTKPSYKAAQSALNRGCERGLIEHVGNAYQPSPRNTLKTPP